MPTPLFLHGGPMKDDVGNKDRHADSPVFSGRMMAARRYNLCGDDCGKDHSRKPAWVIFQAIDPLVGRRSRRALQLTVICASVAISTAIVLSEQIILAQGQPAREPANLIAKAIEDIDGEVVLNNDLPDGPGIRLVKIQAPVTDEQLVVLQRVPELECLWLWDTKLTDKSMGVIGSLKNLRFLDVWGGRLTDKGISRLQGLTKLERLTLYDVGITDASLEFVRNLQSIRTLSLCRTGVTAAGVERLRGARPGLHVILSINKGDEKPQDDSRLLVVVSIILWQ
jgi:hypothetical protein